MVAPLRGEDGGQFGVVGDLVDDFLRRASAPAIDRAPFHHCSTLPRNSGIARVGMILLIALPTFPER